MTDILSKQEFEEMRDVGWRNSEPVEGMSTSVNLHALWKSEAIATIEALDRYINFKHAYSMDDLVSYEDLTLLLREKGWVR